MKFLIQDDAGEPAFSHSIIVEAPTWFDARAQAPRLWAILSPRCKGQPPFRAKLLPDNTVATAELEWRGHDMGRTQDRKLWIRTKSRRGWSEWAPVT